MKPRGIILTGTSGSGKTTIANHITATDKRFLSVRAVTTRAPRQDDLPGTYDYISEEEFQQLWMNDKLFVHANYRGKLYGIRESDISAVEANNCVPILTLTPESAISLSISEPLSCTDHVTKFMSVFVDAADYVLDERVRKGRGQAVTAEVVDQRLHDRKTKESFTYVVTNDEVEVTSELIKTLWTYWEASGVLSSRIISLMLRCGMLLQDASVKNVSGASYDLSLGEEYFYGGQIKQLTDNEPFLLIEPYDYAIVTSNERTILPRDVTARFDLSVSLFCQGIILSNGPQVDPGFRGPLFCLLFNTSSSPVLLKRGQHYATVEFHKLLEPTYSYKGRYQDKKLLDYLPGNVTRGAINELKKELERVERQSQNVQNIAFAILSLILALIAVLVIFR